MNLRCLSALSGLVLGAVASQAAMIDFDGYADGTNLHGVDLGGVTATSTIGLVEVFASGRYGVSYHTPYNAIGAFFDGAKSAPIRFDFATATSMVSIWVGDGGGDDDSAELAIYDGASLLGTVTTGVWNGDPYRNLTLSGTHITHAIVTHLGPTDFGIGLDTLEFAAVPEPATMAVLGLGALALVKRRKR